MASFYNLVLSIFTLTFLISHPLHAQRWPLMRVPDAEKSTVVLSKKKYALRSPTYLKNELAQKRRSSLFPHIFLSSSSEQKVEDLFWQSPKNRSTKVRVLLTEAENNNASEWKFTCPYGFIFQLEDDNKGRKKTTKITHLTLQVKDGFLYWNGRKITQAIKLRPIQGFGEYNGVMYDGDFIINRQKDILLCINQVELEDYVKAVLRTESWPGWPLEVNKVFAIACRSYVMFKVLEAQRTCRAYDIKNTNAHQTYRGKHEISVLKCAVEQTKGVVLGFEGKPILAMFDCCCGGIIPAHIDDFNFDKAPYLARTYACNYCKQSSLYSWQIVYEQITLEKLLQDYLQKIVRLSDIHITKKDKAGLVMEIKLKGPKYMTIVSGKKLYSLLKDVKSFCFDIQKKSHGIIFIGYGFGHHIGLCQWGACQMVRDGWDYKSILRFYYPGTYFMHLI